uniref:Uncharacterized protein n=1 Tax=Sphaerodactylus townsendi TaxID=933632 RepID=A0ACB8EFK9_9SAUR
MGGAEMAISPRSLHSELMCPICLDMLKHTMTTKECLHRFCSDCMEILAAAAVAWGDHEALRPRSPGQELNRPSHNQQTLLERWLWEEGLKMQAMTE